MPRTWTPTLDARISAELAAGCPVPEIAARLGLTPDSVRWRLKVLGRSLREGWRSREEVARALGVSRRAVAGWDRDGLLAVASHGRRWRRVTEADLRAFVEQYAGVLVVPARVTDRGLRALAETSAAVRARRAVMLTDTG